MDDVSFSGNQFQSVATRSPQFLNAGGGPALWVFGVLCILKALGNETGGSSALFESIVPAGQGPGMHVHLKADETWYVLEGELEWYVGNRVYRATAGSFVHIPKFVPHTFANKSGKTARMMHSYVPAGHEMWFFEVGQPTTDISDHTAPSFTEEDADKAHVLGKDVFHTVYIGKLEADS